MANRFILQWHLGEQCNLKCLHCYQENHNYVNLPYKDLENIYNQFKSIKDTTSTITIDKILTCYNNMRIDSISKNTLESIGKLGLGFGHYPVIDNDITYYKQYPLINELVYYKLHKFRDAWFVDNLGSFLIIIERKKK